MIVMHVTASGANTWSARVGDVGTADK